MNLYPFIRPLLFTLEAEFAHSLSLKTLKLLSDYHLLSYVHSNPIANQPVRIMGLDFKNRLGLAAGLDKNGNYINSLIQLGFGFIEIGTVTPRPQLGNPKPRLFRLAKQQAIVNRMGFNNLGIDHLLKQVKQAQYSEVKLGINIGKNADTPLEKASKDYLIGFQKAYPLADYITVNISSPNTKDLRQLQQIDALKQLLSLLKQQQQQLSQQYQRYVPLVVKIAPDLIEEEIRQIAEVLLALSIDGVIATNTTIDKSMLPEKWATEAGGLSGKPLMNQSTQVVKQLANILQGQIPIIAVGGIFSAEDALEKLVAGASLIQIYTGLIYQGPQLINDILLKI